MSLLDNSFDNATNVDSSDKTTHNENTTGHNENLDGTIKFPIKKLSEVFDACIAAPHAQETMKVYLRVRPSSAGKGNSTIELDSETSIVTQAPESSKRAQYTKLERRQYVRQDLCVLCCAYESALLCT